MLNNCCFCISLKTATLSLAILGIVSHFYSAFTLTALSGEFDNNDLGTVFGLAAYSFFSGFACLAGAIGVFKNDIKHLQFFSTYYWIDLGLHTFFAVGSSVLIFSLNDEICKEIVNEMKDNVLDMNTCKSIYIQTAWIATLTMAISMLLKLHFAFAIYSYIQHVGREGQGESIHFEEQVIIVTYPTSYDKKQKPIFVAGKEFVVDKQ